MLKKAKVPHNVLNARYHEQEAAIVAEAGVPGAVTIATNMAGRGTDIQLGGNVDMRVVTELEAAEKEGRPADPAELRARIEAEIAEAKARVLAAGGLYVLATERHESRRIDNQLRGRSGRQGDPGRTNFYLSLEDDLMRIFGSDRLNSMLGKLGMKEGEAIIHPWVNKALEKAQGKVEARNFDIRKNLLKYDDVMNDQRKAIFAQRREIMEAKDVSDVVDDMRHQVVEDLVAEHVPAKAYADQWDVEGLARRRSATSSASSCPSPSGPTRRASTTRTSASACWRPPTSRWRRRPSATAPRPCARSRSRCSCRRSTPTGASTSSPSTTSGASSASAATPSATR